MYFLKYLFLGVLVGFCIIETGWAQTKGEAKFWNNTVINGALSVDHKVRYYLQPQLVFLDDKYKFETALMFLGLGYQVTPKGTLWIMNGLVYQKNSKGKIARRETIRQQWDYVLAENPYFHLLSTSRLEERKEVGEPVWAVRLRQRLAIRLPFMHWERHSLSLFDEVFFDLNHPTWINGSTFLEQNRAFIGIGTTVSKQAIVDLGYMNQYNMKKSNSMANVLYMGINVILD